MGVRKICIFSDIYIFMHKQKVDNISKRGCRTMILISLERCSFLFEKIQAIFRMGIIGLDLLSTLTHLD